jgi:glucokinase
MDRDRETFGESAVAGTLLGIDIGGTKIKTGYVTPEGRLEECGLYSTPSDPKAAVDLLSGEIAGYEIPVPLAGIGIGCPGPLDQETGRVLSPPNLPGWHGFPLTEELEKRLGVPVRLENDGNAGALGEARHGSGAGYSHVFYLAVGTGLGAGIVIDSKIYRGAYGLAAEMWSFSPDVYGGTGCADILNDVCSGNGLVARFARAVEAGVRTRIEPENADTYAILAAWESGDPAAEAALEDARCYLTGIIVNVLTMLAPEIVVLGGGLCTDARWLVEPVCRMVRDSVPIEQLKDIPVRRAELWDSAVLYGAASLFT